MSVKSMETTLGEIANFTNGYSFKSGDYVAKSSDTLEVLRMGYIKRGGGFKEDEKPVFVPKAYPKNVEKQLLRKDDIVMAMTDMKNNVAILGNVARVPESGRFVLNQRVGLIRSKDPKVCSQLFLYHYLQSNSVVEIVRSRANSGVQVNLSTEGIKATEVVLPPLAEQKKIADFLDSLEHLENNLQSQNTTLEALAQTLFRSWFVNFDPVHAKAAGQTPEVMSPELASLFPSEFVESELGMIPKGWVVSKVEDVIVRQSVGKKFDQKTVSDTGKVPVYDQGKSGIIGYHNEVAGVIASEENPVCIFANHTCYYRYIANDFSAIQNVLPYRAKPYINIDWLWCATNGLQKFIEYKGHWPDFMIHKLVVPTHLIAQAFGEVTRPFYKTIWNNQHLSNTLAQLRDELLPRLISGKLRIEEAEEAVAEVLGSTAEEEKAA